jgi:hypothetical protein
MLNIILPILFFLSLAGIFYIICKKIPVLANISLESLQNREPFTAFLKRLIKSFFSHIHPKKIKIYFLILAEKVLTRFRATTLKMHKTIEILSKDIKQKSQQEKWEHKWFSPKNEMDKDREDNKKPK